MKAPARYENMDQLKRLIPVHMRHLVKKGLDTPLWRVNRPDYDRLPIGTFLFETMMGTGGRNVEMAMRVVQPNRPELYPANKLTEGKRLLYAFWGRGHALKWLADPNPKTIRHIVLPDDPRFAMLEAFKIACDHKHAAAGRGPFEPTLMYRALGVEPMGEPST